MSAQRLPRIHAIPFAPPGHQRIVFGYENCVYEADVPVDITRTETEPLAPQCVLSGVQPRTLVHSPSRVLDVSVYPGYIAYVTQEGSVFLCSLDECVHSGARPLRRVGGPSTLAARVFLLDAVSLGLTGPEPALLAVDLTHSRVTLTHGGTLVGSLACPLQLRDAVLLLGPQLVLAAAGSQLFVVDFNAASAPPHCYREPGNTMLQVARRLVLPSQPLVLAALGDDSVAVCCEDRSITTVDNVRKQPRSARSWCRATKHATLMVEPLGAGMLLAVGSDGEVLAGQEAGGVEGSRLDYGFHGDAEWAAAGVVGAIDAFIGVSCAGSIFVCTTVSQLTETPAAIGDEGRKRVAAEDQ